MHIEPCLEDHLRAGDVSTAHYDVREASVTGSANVANSLTHLPQRSM